MANGKFVAYYRVSTAKQGASGLGLEGQRQAVLDFLNGGEWTLTGEFTEIESGKVDDRPELAKAIREAKRTGSTLIVARLDRLSRNATFLLKFDDMVKRAGIDLHVCDQPHLDRFMLGVHALVAERERELIGQRTKAALQAAKARGVILGTRDGKKLNSLGVSAIKAKADQNAENASAVIAQLQRAGVLTYAALADGLNARAIPTPRGGQWHASSVRNVMLRTQQA